MPDIALYQIDAFTDRLFSGNPAAVCPLHQWLPDALMQSIALENNLAETAFFVPEGKGFRLRWFTPTVEVPLCGHATLATAHLILDRLGRKADDVVFETLSGSLTVVREGDLLMMDLPADPPERVETPPDALIRGIGGEPLEVWAGRGFYVALLRDADAVRAVAPGFLDLASLDRHATIVTAPGGQPGIDFVSRVFAPAAGIPEDPVTGSAHCVLTPFWSPRLRKRAMIARQVSARGGTLHVEDRGTRTGIGGRAVLAITGAIHLPDLP